MNLCDAHLSLAKVFVVFVVENFKSYIEIYVIQTSKNTPLAPITLFKIVFLESLNLRFEEGNVLR